MTSPGETEETRFRVKVRDLTNINIGVVSAEFIVVAESPAEAEMYVREYTAANCTCCEEMTTTQIAMLS